MLAILRGALVTGFIVTSSVAAFAGDAEGTTDQEACERFAWSIARERSAFSAPGLPSVASGSALQATAGALLLSLKPAEDTSLPVPSERSPKSGTYAGFVTIEVPAKAGTYQVTISEDAWVDLSQDGRTTLKPVSISSKSGCPGVRKSLRFALEAGSVTIQINRAPSPQIKVDLTRAE